MDYLIKSTFTGLVGVCFFDSIERGEIFEVGDGTEYEVVSVDDADAVVYVTEIE